MLRQILFALFLPSALSIELTSESWQKETEGKTVFVKFFAPWCGHCKKMKPAWDKLMTKYEDSESVLIADVDCIEAGKSLCDEVGVSGFPTIKYGVNWNLQDYKKGRDFESLDEFASQLKPACNVNTLEYCTDEQKTSLEELKDKSLEQLEGIVSDHDANVDIEKETFEKAVKDLQEQFMKLKQDHESELEQLKTKFKINIVKGLIYHLKSDSDEADKTDL